MRIFNRGKCTKTQKRWMNTIFLRATVMWSVEELFDAPPANEAQRQEYVAIMQVMRKDQATLRKLQRYLREYMK